ncbi:MAG: hypothetical protein WCL19_03690 [Verrucomicrobiota bacterium]
MKLQHLLVLPPIWFCQVHAAETTDWQYTGAVYAPLMGLDGTIGIGPVSSQVDIPFRDILKNLDAGLTGTFEARRSRWSITGDFIWIKLSASVEPTPLSDVNLKEEELMASLALGYELYGNKQTTLDILGGGALTYLSADLNLSMANFGNVQRSYSGSLCWVDPFVGIRIRHRLTSNWGIFATVLYDGFHVSSDSYWQALAGVSYRITDFASFAAAYRIIATDYRKGSIVYDVETSGPNLGFVFRF